MGAVANITERGNDITLPKVMADLMAPAFVKANCMMNLMHTEDLPVLSNVKQFIKDGSLTAAALAEATALAIDTNGELTRTAVDATVAKVAVSSGLSVEALRMTTLTAADMAAKQGQAIARFVDNDALSLFSGLATSVTSVAGITIDDIMLGQMNIYASECPNKEVPLACNLAHKGYHQVKKEIRESGASVWSNQSYLSILGGAPASNCFVGSLGNIDFYATSGHATSGGDNVQAIFHPMWCFAGVFDTAPVLVENMKGAEGLYQELVSYFFYDVIEWNDLAGVKLLSDS